MKRLICCLSLGCFAAIQGCSSCGSGQQPYPVGSYPLPGYGGATYPYSGYPPASPATGYSSVPATPPYGSPAIGGQLPAGSPPLYSTPLTPGYPSATGIPPGSYPPGYPGQSPGVPFNSVAPSQPLFGR